MMRRVLLTLIASVLSFSAVAAVAEPTNATINPAGFNPGRIIDDAIFYDPDGMGGVNDIQAFLDAHVPTCDTWGTQPSGYGNLNNAQYAQQVKGWPGPPYVCLDNYYENPSTGETSFEKGGGAFAGGLSTAQIIYNAAQTYKINPKVLLVMLRKESLNLFSDSWPMKSQYKYAMGYACPDSGPNYSANCQSSKAGFYNQMTYAAWQLRYYYDHMGSYNYAPGRWNTIQYNPDPNCGTKNVYIDNYATASLYIYTPYTPNDAALNAYPGEAPCGAYGNRNFWFFWQEWFGSTLLNGNFVRSVNNATVYLIGDKMKYPVADPAILGAAGVLGGVGYVSQSYLDSIPTGALMGRIIQGPDGTIYFYDSNIKLPFTSCAMVSDFGGACGSAAELTQAEINSFVNGPAVTKGMKTTSGKTFYISGGTKNEVLDDQSLASAGVSTGYNSLNESAFSYLAYGTPYIRSGVVIKSRQDGSRQLVNDGATNFNVKRSAEADKAFSSLSSGVLDDQSLQKLTVSGGTISDLVSDQSGKSYVFSSDGKRQIPDIASFNKTPVQVSTSLANLLNGSGSLSNPSLVKSPNDATVYVIVNGEKRPLVAMDDLKSITGEDQPYIAWVSNDTINSIPTGNIIVGAGRLVKTPSSATVYMTDGYDKLVPMSSFEPAADLGLNGQIRIISDSILSKYTVDSTILKSYVTCSGGAYVGMGRTAYAQSLSSQTPRALQPQTCNVVRKSATVPQFARTSDGTIYKVESGTLRPISSFTTYQSLNSSGSAPANITYSTYRLFPIGSTIQ